MSEIIEYLISSCEIWCVKDCCGLDAFNFSPVHIASYLLSIDYSTSKIQELKQSLSELINCYINSIENGLVYLPIISDSLNREELENLNPVQIENWSFVQKSNRLIERRKIRLG